MDKAARIEELQKKYNRLKEENKRLKQKMGEDPLTGLLNSRSNLAQQIFQSFLERCKRRSEEEEGFSCWLVFVDLLRFKQINDNYGHKVGDEVLKIVAQSLYGALRTYDVKAFLESKNKGKVTRYGGDEFILGLEDIKYEDLSKVFLRIINTYSKLIKKNEKLKEKDLCEKLGFTFGAVSLEFLDGKKTLENWIKKADENMYKAKEYSHEKENRFSVYVANKNSPQSI